MANQLKTCTLTTVAVIMIASYLSATEIRQQQLDVESPAGGEVRSAEVLRGEIAGVEIEHLAITGPVAHSEELADDCDSLFLFLAGRGMLHAGERKHKIVAESIVAPFASGAVSIEVEAGDSLHYLRLRKLITPQDRQDIQGFPAPNRGGVYWTKFGDCPAYTEAIKSAKTVSRTVLPPNYVPRVAMGTVETTGPDKVGAHEHPMLDQLFLGLAQNNIIVHANDAEAAFPEFAVLHIPLGSSHWVEVTEGHQMRYMWMDFFLTAEGQEWLKTHKYVDEKTE